MRTSGQRDSDMIFVFCKVPKVVVAFAFKHFPASSRQSEQDVISTRLEVHCAGVTAWVNLLCVAQTLCGNRFST